LSAKLCRRVLAIDDTQLVSGWPAAAWPNWSFLCRVLAIDNTQLVSGWPPAAWRSWSFLCRVLAIDDAQLATCVWLATCCLAKLVLPMAITRYDNTFCSALSGGYPEYKARFYRELHELFYYAHEMHTKVSFNDFHGTYLVTLMTSKPHQ